MLSEKQRLSLAEKLFSNETLLREAAKTLYGSEDEAYNLSKRELEIVLSDATDYEIDRLETIAESVGGTKDYSNNYRSQRPRRAASDYDGDDFPNGATGNIQRKQRRTKSGQGDNPMTKEWDDE